MSQVTLPYQLSDGTVADAAQVMSNFSAITNVVNGNIDNTNLSTGLTITDSHLSQIQSAAKVNGTALTNLLGIPSGAGVIPTANLPVVTTQILNYGTSSTTGTSVALQSLIMAYGTFSLTADSSQAITNLPFTSSSTYVVMTTNVTSSGVLSPSVVVNSGSQLTIYNQNGGGSISVSWVAIGY